MSQSPKFKPAGIAIINAVYEICAAYEINRSEIPILLSELAVATAEAQSPPVAEPIPPKPQRIAAFRALVAEGLPITQIARILHICKDTAYRWKQRYVSLDGNIPIPESRPEHPSNATDRRADDQVPGAS